MSKREEFKTSVLVAVAKRATREISHGINDQYCEECGQPTKGRFDIDHINPCGLTGKATIENARLLCKPCHKAKTKKDKGDIAEAKRREANSLHVSRRPTQKIASNPDALRAAPKPSKVGHVRIDKSALGSLPRRNPLTGEIYHD